MQAKGFYMESSFAFYGLISVPGCFGRMNGIGDNRSQAEKIIGGVECELGGDGWSLAEVTRVTSVTWLHREDGRRTTQLARRGTEKILQFVDSFFTVFFALEPSCSARAVSVVFFIIVLFIN
jgi:hypothetical protein